MKKIKLSKPIVHKYESGSGVYSIMVHPDDCPEISKMYKRENLGIKLFPYGSGIPIEDFVWGGWNQAYERRNAAANKLVDCVRVQNLASLYGLAPRVYDIALFDFRDKEFYGLVTDYITGEIGHDDEYSKMMSLLDKYGVRLSGGIDSSPKNCVGGKWVDFQFISIDDEIFKKYCIYRADNFTDWGSKDWSYEDVEELGIEGQRNTKRRSTVLELDQIDFKGKTVLDVGCSTGSFSRYACREGAARVVGVDIGETPQAAAEISYYLSDFNIDYYQSTLWQDLDELEKKTKIKQYDIVFFLSVNHQIGYQSQYINRICKDYIILEGHSAENEMTYRPKLEGDFNQVHYKGRMQNNARPAFVCRK